MATLATFEADEADMAILRVLSDPTSDADATAIALAQLASAVKSPAALQDMLEPDAFLERTRPADGAAPLEILDVRSPGEFHQGHIPGARNVPLFDDGERAAVGTVFKRKGKEAAMALGMRFVAPKLDALASAAGGAAVALHCSRGGLRFLDAVLGDG